MIVAFIGPSIPAVAAREIVDALILPPARQGDILRAARHKPLAIALIDGYFHSVPAVWHKEILWAMNHGVHVLGGASMGALRAAELADFGMVGVGKIFEQYRDGVLTADDEVALRHSDAEHDYRALSEPMVNIRATIDAAVLTGIVDDSVARAVVARAKATWYPDRSWRTLCDTASYPAPLRPGIDALSGWVATNRIDQKRSDAEATLAALRELNERALRRAPVSYRFEHTALWEQLVREAGELHLPAASRAVMVPAPELFEALETPERRAEMEALAAYRLLAIDESRRRGHQLEEDGLVARVHAFRRARDLWDPDELERWLRANNMTLPRLVQLVEDEARIERVQEELRPELAGALADTLRARGTYAELMRRLGPP